MVDFEGVVDRVTLSALDDVTGVGVSEMGVAMLMGLGIRVAVDGAIPKGHYYNNGCCLWWVWHSLSPAPS